MFSIASAVGVCVYETSQTRVRVVLKREEEENG